VTGGAKRSGGSIARLAPFSAASLWPRGGKQDPTPRSKLAGALSEPSMRQMCRGSNAAIAFSVFACASEGSVLRPYSLASSRCSAASILRLIAELRSLPIMSTA
jgi:hypothetical protein